MEGPIYQPVTPLRSQEACLDGFVYTITLVPGGVIGVALKLKLP